MWAASYRLPFVLLCLLGSSCLAAASPYLSPVSIVADPNVDRLYVAEATANRISVLDLAAGRVSGHIPVGARPVGLALSADSGLLYVTSATPAGTVQIVDTECQRVVGVVAVSHTPVAAATAPDGQMLYVCNQFDNTVSVVDLHAREEIARVPVPREPVAAALTPDGRFLLVANLLPAGPANADYVAAVVSVIDTATRSVVRHIELPDGSTSLRGIAVSPDGRYAYVTHILARYRFPVTYLERGWVNTNALTVLDLARQRYVNTVLLDEAGHGAANPWGVACTPDGAWIVVAHAGTHELSIIERAQLHARLLPSQDARDFVSASASTATGHWGDPLYAAGDVPNDLAFLVGIRRRLKLAGNGPRGVAIVGTKIYAAEYFSDSIGVVELGADGRPAAESIPLGVPTPMTKERLGAMLFHDASEAFQSWHSCATCHGGQARVDGLNWDLLNDGMLNPKNGKSLLLAHRTPPAMATGVRADAETAVRSGIYYVQFAIPTTRKAEALNAYLRSLEPVASPYLVHGHPSEAAENGRRIFVEAGCASCHAGELFTDLQRHNVGTATEEEPRGRFDTPTLVEVWRTAPYLHDGRATTIREVLTKFNPDDRHGRTSSLTEDELSNLIEYVLTR
jgi:YVTN family beta-propeller protein